MKKIVIIICLFVIGLAGFAQDKQAVYDHCSNSLVTLRSVDVLGYGFFIESDLVVTNYQVINKARQGAAKAVLTSGKSVNVLGYVAASEEANLVILKVDYQYAMPLSLLESGVKAGDKLYFFTEPDTVNVMISEGQLLEIKDFGYTKFLKISTPNTVFNSGFPVVNTEGKVAGISVPSLSQDTTSSYAISYEKIKEVYDARKSYVEDLKSLSPPTRIDNNVQSKSEIVSQFINQGNSRLLSKDYKGAVEKFSAAIKLAPADPDAYVFRGQAYIYLMQYKDALADFNKAIDIEPNFAEAYDLRGIAKAELGDKTGACEDWVKSYELGFNDAFKLIREFCEMDE